MDQIRFTKAGYKKLQEELADLQQQRPGAVEHLKKAREMGDLSENGYYKASRAKLSWIDGQIMRKKYYLKQAKIIEEEQASSAVQIGKTVVLTDGKREINYDIVGDLEANPAEGKISLLSPLGKALSGKHEGDIFDLHIPAGKISYTIKHVHNS